MFLPNAAPVAVGRDILNCYFAGVMQCGGDFSNRGLDAMYAWGDAAEIGEGSDEADGSVAAHADVSNVVEEDHAGGALGVDGLAQERADDHIRAAGFIHRGGSQVVVFASQELQALRQGTRAQIWSTGEDEAGGLPLGMRVEERDFARGWDDVPALEVSVAIVPDFIASDGTEVPDSPFKEGILMDDRIGPGAKSRGPRCLVRQRGPR